MAFWPLRSTPLNWILYWPAINMLCHELCDKESSRFLTTHFRISRYRWQLKGWFHSWWSLLIILWISQKETFTYVVICANIWWIWQSSIVASWFQLAALLTFADTFTFSRTFTRDHTDVIWWKLRFHSGDRRASKLDRKLHLLGEHRPPKLGTRTANHFEFRRI